MVMPIIPLWALAAAAATGTAAKAINTNRADQKQGRNILQGIREQGRKQGEADSRVKQQVKGLQNSSADADRAKSLQDYTQALQTSMSRNKRSGVPGGSQRFQDAVRQGDTRTATMNQAQSGQMADISSPIMQREREGQSVAAAASDLGRIQDQANSLEYLRKLRAATIRPNPWVNLGADMLSSGASAVAALQDEGGDTPQLGTPTSSKDISGSGSLMPNARRAGIYADKTANPYAMTLDA